MNTYNTKLIDISAVSVKILITEYLMPTSMSFSVCLIRMEDGRYFLQRSSSVNHPVICVNGKEVIRLEITPSPSLQQDNLLQGRLPSSFMPRQKRPKYQVKQSQGLGGLNQPRHLAMPKRTPDESNERMEEQLPDTCETQKAITRRAEKNR